MNKDSPVQTFQRHPIVSPAAWRGDEIGGKAGLARPLSTNELSALDRFLVEIGSKPVLDVAPDDFRDSSIDALAGACRYELTRGRGAMVLTGLDPDRYGAEGYRHIYWYLARLLGTPAPQSERGDLLGFVRQETDNPYGRGYISNLELNFHNDFHEMLSLACVQTACRGGESALASAVTVHNILREERPDLLEVLYKGWYDGLNAFYKIFKPRSELPRTFVPYFGSHNQIVSLHGIASLFTDQAAQERNVTPPPVLKEAVAAVQEIAARPGVAARFMLQPGEMVYWHNWTLLHARSAFENAPGHERVLMRIWLHPFEQRDAAPSIRERAVAVDLIHNHLREQAVRRSERP